MGPVAIVGAAILSHKHPELALAEFARFAGIILVWPLQVPLAVAAIWCMAAATGFLIWKGLEAAQWLTGLPVGRRFAEWMSRVPKFASPREVFGWWHRKMSEAYPLSAAGGVNG